MTLQSALQERQAAAPFDPEIELLLPENDVVDPELSIVIPALNEGLTITDFVAWCQEGLDKAGIVGEILIVDSSTDDTAQLALAGGARVLRSPKRGLGRAYIDAIPYIRGKWVLMGDADCTYDFRELNVFVESFRAGNEFVMGSRWKGSIEPGAMPKLHQYFGTPITTWILNRLYSSKFSDIHCGMRGLTLDALKRMGLESQSWEYASEIVLKSVHMRLKTDEVPVRFLKDRDGRESHHRRMGWFSPWQAAWINLRAMFVYGADFFVLRPGAVMFVLGLIIVLPLSLGPITLGSITFSLYSMLGGVVLLVIGLESFLLGAIGQVLFDYTGRFTTRWLQVFAYSRTVIVSWLIMLLGLAAMVPLVVDYFNNDQGLSPSHTEVNHLAVLGLALLISGFTVFAHTLILHGAALSTKYGPARDE